MLAACGDTTGAESIPERTLRIACWVEDMELSLTVERFQELHNDITVEVVSYYDETATDVYAAMDRMNTRLISGEIPDLFYLNSMDVAALRNGGFLADLYPLMSQDEEFIESDYFMEIWDLFAVDGMLYEFIPSFEIAGLAGSSSFFGDRTGWTLDEFNLILDQYSDYTVLDINRGRLCSYMIQYSLYPYLNLSEGTCDFENEYFCYFMDFIAQFPSQMTGDDGALLSFSDLNTVYTYLDMVNTFGHDLSYMAYPSDDAYGPSAKYTRAFAISTAAEDTELGWEFMKFTLTEEIQELLFGNSSLPMNRNVLEVQLDQAMLPAENPNSLAYGMTDDGGNAYGPLNQDDVERFYEILDSVTQVRLEYDSLRDLVREEIDEYLSGSKTAEMVAASLQNRATTFLQERQ